MCLSGKVQVQPLETKLSPMTIGVAGVELGGGEDGFPGGGGGWDGRAGMGWVARMGGRDDENLRNNRSSQAFEGFR